MAVTKRKTVVNLKISARKRVSKKCAAGIGATRNAETEKGYNGKAMASPWELPKGGLKKSPAWKLVAMRCGVSPNNMPPAKSRAGAPIKGGFPLERWPVNVIVDAERAFWLPDEWGQGVKNTGPGGSYVVWISPQGKICYHRHQCERIFGRPASALDGFTGILRKVESAVKADSDKRFLAKYLSAAEKKHILPADKFHFAIVSARRAQKLDGQHDIMLVEAHFRNVGIRPTWYVDAASLDAYKALTLNAVVGGKLTPARNMALDDAAKKGKICVQVSDDISMWEYYDMQKVTGVQGDFSVMNGRVKNAEKKGLNHALSPLGAAQFLLAKMRASELKPQLGGVFPLANMSLAVCQEEFTYEHFILGDFFVVDKSPVRFDPEMTLKEDYDFTAAHLSKHGAVFRANRLCIRVKHSTNSGGAVAVRDGGGSEERKNIDILQRKWPGVFYLNGRRKDEVVMSWGWKDSPGKPKTTRKSAGVVKTAGVVKKRILTGSFSPKARAKYTGPASLDSYIAQRCSSADGFTVEELLTKFTYADSKGATKKYGLADLRYDVKCGRLRLDNK